MHPRGRPSGPVVSLSWPSSTAILLAPLLPFIPSPLPLLSLSLPLSPLSRASIILWPVAFRNLFVIKAAIYFTLIEEIGRLPLAATIYHVPTPLSLSLLRLFHTSSRLKKIIRCWRCIHEYLCTIARIPARDFCADQICIYICFIFTASYGYTDVYKVHEYTKRCCYSVIKC